MGIRKTPLPFPNSGSQIRKYRKYCNYSVQQLSQLVELDAKYLSNIESGRQMVSVKTLYKLSIILNVSIENLLTESAEQENDLTKAAQLMEDINGLTDNEMDLVHNFISHILPLTRKFKEF